MTIEAQAKKDAVAMATDSSGFFETITWYPNGVVLDARAVRAVVARDDLQPLPDSPVHNAPIVRLRIPNDATYGVTVVHPHKDTALVALRYGATPTLVSIHRVVAQVFGFWVVEAYG